MKVLLCHSYYQQRGGEDQSFEEERALLRDYGHEVIELTRHNRELAEQGTLAQLMMTLWNRQTANELRHLITTHRPDVLHCTNTFPLISPSVIHQAAKQRVAVVQSLRNYRLICPGTFLMRDDQPCQDCVGRAIPWPAVRHGCYRDSRPASAAVVAMLVLHRALGTWRRKVDAFFTLTNFARSKFIEAGFPKDRVHVKTNSVAPVEVAGIEKSDHFVFVGRLSSEKGVSTLLAAWAADPGLPPLKILGDGPLADEVRAAQKNDSRIHWLGRRDHSEVQEILSRSQALVMPSLWYETFGRTIIEAYSVGTPVIASRLGAMEELVEEGRTGLFFEPGQADSLAEQVWRFVALPLAERQNMAAVSKSRYFEKYTPESNYQRLIEIYETARQRAKRRTLSATKCFEPKETLIPHTERP